MINAMAVTRTKTCLALCQPCSAAPVAGFVREGSGGVDDRGAMGIRGGLECRVAKLAGERVLRTEQLAPIRQCLARIDRLVQRWTSGTDSLARYIALNGQFHKLLVDLADSPMVRRAVDRAVALPFASPNAFLMGHAQKKEGRQVVVISQVHHHAIVDAIANREPARADAMAREHSRLAQTSLEMILRNRHLLYQIAGASLIRFPEGSQREASRGD